MYVNITSCPWLLRVFLTNGSTTVQATETMDNVLVFQIDKALTIK